MWRKGGRTSEIKKIVTFKNKINKCQKKKQKKSYYLLLMN